ncbi:MAG: DUF799 family lipoprotein [Elusimicrobia bacterium]|nr:DUF799 family lipoprotein [Elusimicrobiota bacterium]
MNVQRITAILAMTGLLFACAGIKPIYLATDLRFPQNAAVLPLGNQTNDMKAPEMIRPLIEQALRQKGYAIFTQAETDERLRKLLGVTDGGQLRVLFEGLNAQNPSAAMDEGSRGSISMKKLSDALPVDTVFYGEVVDFGITNLGFYREKRVHLAFKMVDLKTGNLLWIDQAKIKERNVATSVDEAKSSFKKGLLEKAAYSTGVNEKTKGLSAAWLRNPLKELSEKAVRRVMATLPRT